MTLFFTLFDEPLPQTTNKIVDCIGSLGNMFQQSRETANDFKIRLNRIWERMETLSYDNLGDIRRAFLQECILEGAYKTKRCVKTLDKKLIHSDLMLDNYTEKSFIKYITSMFTNSNVYDNGKMKSMNGGKAADRGRAAKTGDESSSDLQTQLDSAFGLDSLGNGTSPITAFNIINML